MTLTNRFNQKKLNILPFFLLISMILIFPFLQDVNEDSKVAIDDLKPSRITKFPLPEFNVYYEDTTDYAYDRRLL